MQSTTYDGYLTCVLFRSILLLFLLALDELLMLNSNNLSSHDQRQKEKLIIAVELG